jgi:hypothetical protein
MTLSESLKMLDPKIMGEVVEEVIAAPEAEMRARFTALKSLFAPDASARFPEWVRARLEEEAAAQDHSPFRRLFELLFSGFLIGWWARELCGRRKAN